MFSPTFCGWVVCRGHNIVVARLLQRLQAQPRYRHSLRFVDSSRKSLLPCAWSTLKDDDSLGNRVGPPRQRRRALPPHERQSTWQCLDRRFARHPERSEVEGSRASHLKSTFQSPWNPPMPVPSSRPPLWKRNGGGQTHSWHNCVDPYLSENSDLVKPVRPMP